MIACRSAALILFVLVSGFLKVSDTLAGAPSVARTIAVTDAAPQIGNMPWPVWTPQIPKPHASIVGKTYYVDRSNGDNANVGTSIDKPFRSIARALPLVAPGDTVLIKKGLYREGIDLSKSRSGERGRPITFAAFGDGEVILDGSTPATWVRVTGTVWRAAISFVPVGVVVNEVPLRQVRQGQGKSTAPQEGLAGVQPFSGKWHFANGVLTADMGGVIGDRDPNRADIIVPNNVVDQRHVYFYRQTHIVFRGLTIRGSGSNGIWGYGSHITVEHCNIKFNGKAAVSFLPDLTVGMENTDNAVLLSHAYHNNLVNWPRGNNGFAESGGGWPGTLVWSGNLRPVARGNIVHMNGGEGIISYGAIKGRETGSALFEQNVVYDNWSVNMYFDNQPNNIARNNYLFNHPPNLDDYLYVGASPYNALDKYTVCLMLADEQDSSDDFNGFANLAGTQVYNNLIVGCRIGIRDYAEGKIASQNHGLRDTRIVNNTIIMPFHRYENAPTYGIYLQDNRTPGSPSRNRNSFIQNNVIYGFHSDSLVSTGAVGALEGIVLSHNIYFGADNSRLNAFKNWLKSGYLGLRKLDTAADDRASRLVDPEMIDVSHFRGRSAALYDYAKARLRGSSPATVAGTPQSFRPKVNFANEPRTLWSAGAF
jgi:hypothetical protein